MSSGSFPALGDSAAKRFVDEKSLTKTRSRTAIKIEGLLVENEELFRKLLSADPERLSAVTESWGQPAFDFERQAPRQVGIHGLLAFPGCTLEAGDSIGEDMSKPRFRIKTTYAGTVLHLTATLNGNQVDWDWRSMEGLHDTVRKECLKFMLGCVQLLINRDIPRLMGKMGG